MKLRHLFAFWLVFTVLHTAALAGDICEQMTEKFAGSLYLDHDKSQATKDDFGVPHFTMLSFENEVRLSCQRVRQQMQSVGWGNVSVCKGLLDPRPAEALARAYVEGPSDPRRCLTTIRVNSFKKQLGNFLEAKDFGSDLNGHVFTSSDSRKLLKAADVGCAKNTTFGGRFSCISKGFEALAARLKKAEGALSGKKKNLDAVCSALNDAGLDPQAIELVAQVSKERNRPQNLLPKDYPEFADCRSYDFPKMLATCGSKPSKIDLSDDAWTCLKTGIHSIWKDSGFTPPSGMSNAFRDRLADLRSRAIELSVLERLCVSDGDALSLFEERKMSPDAQVRCHLAAFDELKKITSWDAFLKESSPKSLPTPPLPNLNLAAKEECPPAKNAVISPAAAQNIQGAGKVLAKANDDSLSDETVVGAKEDGATLAQMVLSEEIEKKEEKREIEKLREELKKVIPPLVPEPAPPQAAASVDSPLPDARYRSEKELIQAAQDELLRWQKKEAGDFEFAQFFLETEFSGRKPAPAQHYFRKLLGKYLQKKKEYKDAVNSAQGSNDDRIEVLMTRMNADFVKDYTRDNALLSNFLEGNGGNCEAESKIIDAVLRDLKLNPDEGKVIGIQVFDDHVQPVVYDKKNRQVWVLHTGQQFKGLVAPIYQPEILLKGYLNAKGAKSPVSDDELLIAAMDPAETKAARVRSGKGKIVQTNTNLILPKPGAVFGKGGGDIPETSRITLSSRKGPLKPAGEFRPLFSEEQRVASPKKRSICLDRFNEEVTQANFSAAYLVEATKAQEHLRLHPEALFSEIDMPSLWLFRHCADRDEFESNDSRLSVLRKIFSREARSIIQSEDIKNYSDLLSDPTRLLGEQGLTAYLKSKERIDQIAEIWSGYRGRQSASKLSFRGNWTSDLLKENPELAALASQWRKLHIYVSEHPEEFMSLRRQFSYSQWEAFQNLVEGKLFLSVAAYFSDPAGLNVTNDPPEALGSWVKLLTDEKKIGFKFPFRAPHGDDRLESEKKRKKETKETHIAQLNQPRPAMEELDESGLRHVLPQSNEDGSMRSFRVEATDPDEEKKKMVKKAEEKKPMFAGLSGAGTQKTGSSRKPEKPPEYLLSPAVFAQLIYEGQGGDVKRHNAEIPRRWTPLLVEALLRDPKHEVNGENYIKLRSWFLAGGYRYISSIWHNLGEGPRNYPGPDSENSLERGLALLYMSWLDQPIDDSVQHLGISFKTIRQGIEDQYGSVESFKEILRKSLDRQKSNAR